VTSALRSASEIGQEARTRPAEQERRPEQSQDHPARHRPARGSVSHAGLPESGISTIRCLSALTTSAGEKIFAPAGRAAPQLLDLVAGREANPIASGSTALLTTFGRGHHMSRTETRTSYILVRKGSIRLPEIEVTVGEGAMLGEIGLFSRHHQRPNSAICETEVEVLTLTQDKVVGSTIRTPRSAFTWFG
jgi:CRP-like cAMP-binding protein